jgi:acyl-CoA synthetase (AMP-forming)/AMP-acid ligase II
VAIPDLASLFDWRTRHQPDEPAYVFVRSDLTTLELTYAQLRHQVCGLARRIAQLTRPGDRVVLVYGPGPDVVVAFWAALCAGVVAVPAPSPDAVRLKRSLPRLRAIAEDADASVALTTTQIREAARGLALEQETGLVDWIVTDLPEGEVADLPFPARTTAELAYLQYTSGSTSRPRGVMLTHRNVLANCAGISATLRPEADSRTLSWLPHFHDYGLVYGIIWPLFCGVPGYLMSPEEPYFLAEESRS